MSGRAKTTPRSAARCWSGARTCPVSRPPGQPVRRYHRQPESLEPVARVRAHRLPGQGPQLAAWRLAPDHPAQVTLEHLHPGALAPPREVGEEPERTLRPARRRSIASAVLGAFHRIVASGFVVRSFLSTA